MNAAGLFNLLSDKTVLKILWWVRTGKKLNLDKPITFNEKLQWLKLNNRDSKLTSMVDKFRVREYVAKTIGEDHLISLIAVWDKPDEIDFDALPDQFVLKCNHNAGVGLCICRDKSSLNQRQAKKKLEKGLSQNFYYSSREWAYKDVQRKIICEKYMEDASGNGLRDYKFFCFNGTAKFIYLSEGLENHNTASISFYDLDGNEMPFHRQDYKTFDHKPEMPDNLNEMIETANTLATDINIPFVRIDLYSIKSKVYFSEMTFYPNSGYIPFDPEEWDATLGTWIQL